MNQQGSLPRYVLITPARNEEAFIEKTLESMVQQTFPPVKWVIVNDGSTDSTGSIVGRYAERYGWIELVNLPVRKERNFAAKVHAFNAGQERVKNLEYEVIGNLDGDVSLDQDHFEFLLGKFSEDPRLGVAGTVFREQDYNSETDSGIDWIAVTTARMMGWKTRSFREKSFFHFRHLGTAERGAFAASFSYGEKDYYLGGHPVWELFRVTYRFIKPPYLVDGLALGLGYGWAMVRRVKRPISKELMKFHRREQMRKLRSVLKTLLAFKRVDKFKLLSE